MNVTPESLKKFAQRFEDETIQKLHNDGFLSQDENHRTRVIVGQKYAKVDIGTSGRFMVEMATGNIFGIKAYGVIHKGHFYGTLDTIDEYFWGDYYPRHKTTPTPNGRLSVPKLTFAPITELNIARVAAANGEVL